ncbi:hypothetical protein GFS24_16605 [Chitinophaga sp. SYP-B3965]|uniref:lamin tail domain-containing protein n=1 Tax=Chitinophaga sp. SYP-B3965 TaxID=2663120 RepID=UPI0012995458|nr:lamin tail domain-containing protein [Chitinophaga sp. SYP-B3965]MRG46743.1 hypothetical protein [Chitinophaga sp. SYP-B3965]
MQPIVCVLLLAVLSTYDPIPARYDVLIHEILADPSPTAGLPEFEFIELKNVSAFPVNLSGWVLKDSSTSVTLPAFILQPDSLVVICSRSALSSFPKALATSSALSLGNEGERLSLYDKSGRLIHSVEYSKDWYNGSIKGNGGWSLEMIDTQWPCAGSENWKASVASNGGTPGVSNSVAGNIPEPPLPELLRVSVTDSFHLQLHFSGIVDSISAVGALAYMGTVTVHFNMVAVQLATPLEKGKIYSLQTDRITDCSNRQISQPAPVSYALPEKADSFDLVINEVLFDPPAGAADFAEIYNRSHKAIDLQDIYFASLNNDGSIKQSVPLVKGPFLLLPGAWLAFSTDLPALCRSYSCKGVLQEIGSLPTLPDEEGNLLLVGADGRIIDALYYKRAWHLSILPATMGISLERVQADGHTQDPGNWHSAAATAGFATPGYANSQQMLTGSGLEGFRLTSEVFSPNNDGQQDVAQLQWNLIVPGYIAQITVFDAEGRPVRHLANNQLLGSKGNINWDGLSDAGQAVRPGIYVIFIRIFNMQGRINTLKLPLVLAGTS